MKLKENIIKNKYKLLTIIGVLLTLSILLAISYAFFGRLIENTNTNAITQINTSYYSLTTEGNTNISLNLTEDSLSIETASNTTPALTSNGGNISLNLTTLDSAKDISCSYDIVYEPINALNSSNSSLKEFTISGSSSSGLSFNEVNVTGNSTVTLLSNATIETNASSSLSTLDTWNFTVNFYNLNTAQDYIVGSNISGNIKLANINCGFNSNLEYGYETILTLNEGTEAIVAKGAPDLTSIETGIVGMYATEDDFGTSYYFRGKVNNNWVKFGKYTSDVYYNSSDYTLYSSCPDGGSCTKIASNGNDMYWRIIRINGDNSIRMIYSGVTVPTEENQYVMGDSNYSTTIGSTPFNTSYDKSEYVGYMYTLGEQHGTSTDSTIKAYLDNWYTFTNLSSYYANNASSNLLADQIYCNDRNTSSTWESAPTDPMSYSSGERISNGTPSLKCTTKADRFTVDDTTNGNGALTYPVGLITIDELLYAGGTSQENTNSEFYLYTGANYWSGSPFGFVKSYAFTNIVKEDGILYINSVENNIEVRAVISLSSKVMLSGTGLYNNPFIIENSDVVVQ
ncbi:MAG: hypothetical protein ACI4XR_05520 [Bacilli bacterium]